VKHSYTYLYLPALLLLLSSCASSDIDDQAAAVVAEYRFMLSALVAIAIIIVLALQRRYERREQRLRQENAQLNDELQQLRSQHQTLQSEKFLHSDVMAKIERIISDHKQFDKSKEKLNDNDWLWLMGETDRQFPGLTMKLQQDYKLNKQEVHLCCLYLTDIPTSHFGLLMDSSTSATYKRANRILEQRMGYEHNATNLRDALKKAADM